MSILEDSICALGLLYEELDNKRVLVEVSCCYDDGLGLDIQNSYGYFDYDEVKEELQEYLSEKLTVGFEYTGYCLLEYNSAQIGNYEPPNVEVPAYWEVVDSKFEEGCEIFNTDYAEYDPDDLPF
jgi:hypothetical protein